MADNQSDEEANGGQSGDHPQAQQDLRLSHLQFLLIEYYILLENVGATREKKLPKKLDDDVFTDSKMDWIQQIAEIHYPPQGSTGDLALQAAKLHRARDALNFAAAPANSGTIAFTLMAGGDQAPPPGLIRLSFANLFNAIRSMIFRKEVIKQVEERQEKAQETDSQIIRPTCDYARIAFPNFVAPARRFRTFTVWLIFGLLTWLALTSALSWHVATGNALLGRIVELNTSIGKVNDEIVAKTATIQQAGFAGDGTAEPPEVGASGVDGKRLVDKLKAELQEHRADREVALGNLQAWLDRGSRFTPRWFGDNSRKPAAAPPVNWQWAAVLLAVLANNVLPILYGVLGAGAAVTRNLSHAMRDYLLSPRHLKLSLIQLSLGAVIGATIGLFVAPSGTDGETAQGILNDIHLSASALCFVAGFGVEGVFQALESVVSRLFNLGGASPPSQ